MSEQMDLNGIMEEIAIQQKARKEILLNKYKKLYNLRFELGLLGNDPYGKPYEDLRDKINDLKQLLEKKDASMYMWITISIDPQWVHDYFEEKEPLDQIMNEIIPTGKIESMNESLLAKALKFSNSKMFSDYLFVIEQRKSDFNEERRFCGQHFHFLLRRNSQYPPSQIDRNTRRVWKDYCDTSKNPKQQRTPCHIMQCPDKYVNDKIGYMIGIKTGTKKNGEEKEKIQSVDKTFRKHFKFNDLYFKICEDQRFKKAIDKLNGKNKI